MEENQNIESGISLVDLFTMLFHNIFIIALITVFVTVLGTIYTFKLVDPKYQSKTDVMVQIDKTNSGGTSANDFDINLTLRLMQTVSDFIKNDIVLDRVAASNVVIDAVGVITPKQIKDGLKVTNTTNSLLVNITYTHENPEAAAIILNEIIDTVVVIANDNYPVLSNTIYRVGLAKTGTYSSPNKTLNVIISIILGGILGVGIALLIEALKTTIRNKKDIEKLLPQYQLIGLIPEIPEKEGETDVEKN